MVKVEFLKALGSNQKGDSKEMPESTARALKKGGWLKIVGDEEEKPKKVKEPKEVKEYCQLSR